MTSRTLSLSVAVLVAMCLHIAPAQALRAQTFVSGAGNNARTCTRPNPCRTFARAVSRTRPGGAIYVLDAADYGPLEITKSISIVNDSAGVVSIRAALDGNGITINAGPNDVINLRGLVIEGGGIGSRGIYFGTGKSLTVENCTIRGFKGEGIFFIPDASANLVISNTSVANNDDDGIEIHPTGTGTVNASLDRVALQGNSADGLIVNGGASGGVLSATVSNSVASNNGGSGFDAKSNAATTSLMVVSSVANANAVGIHGELWQCDRSGRDYGIDRQHNELAGVEQRNVEELRQQQYQRQRRRRSLSDNDRHKIAVITSPKTRLRHPSRRAQCLDRL